MGRLLFLLSKHRIFNGGRHPKVLPPMGVSRFSESGEDILRKIGKWVNTFKTIKKTICCSRSIFNETKLFKFNRFLIFLKVKLILFEYK